MSYIVLDYIIDQKEIDAWCALGAGATAVDFVFGVMTGSVFFRINKVSFDSAWEWVPILCYAGTLYDTVKKLEVSGHRSMGFTESGDELKFICDEDMVVHVSTTWSRATAEVPHSDLLVAARQFYRRVLDDLAKGWPALAESPEYTLRYGRAYSD